MDAENNSDLAKAIDQNTKSNQKLAETLDLFIQVITPELKKTDTVRRVQEERNALLKDARRLFGE
jgi:nucleoid DNA-binding protein|tara:strand:- start:373 stop:567 length:195 start_codon:yes stop_codon:yes gene_type:complete